MNEFIEPKGSMVWGSVIVLLMVLIPNLIRLFSVSRDLIKSLPRYYKLRDESPSLPESEKTRIQNAFATLFFVIQTHAANVLACGILGWILLWHGQMSNLAPWVKVAIWGLAIASIIGNLFIVYERIQNYLQVLKVYRLLGGIRERWKSAAKTPDAESFSLADTVGIWGGVGLHILSAGLLAILVYLLY